ncbi:MAG TPA: DUF922 domain-containing protein [Vicinamibacterales bacterium]|nr:DUF922 domain-containing protein [Vicinamibacterales bacterium]
MSTNPSPRFLLAVLAGVALAAPAISAAPAGRQQTVSLAEALDRQIADRHGVVWSGARRLTWDDFEAPVTNAGANEAAHLEYALFYGVRCTGRALEFRVVTAMIPSGSWVRSSVLESAADSARTLQHEQTHFDLAEVHARKMRTFFDGLYEPCLKSSEELAALADRMVKAEATEQKRYDEETANGRRADAQQKWNADVAARLLSKDLGAADRPQTRRPGVGHADLAVVQRGRSGE